MIFLFEEFSSNLVFTSLKLVTNLQGSSRGPRYSLVETFLLNKSIIYITYKLLASSSQSNTFVSFRLRSVMFNLDLWSLVQLYITLMTI